MAAGRMHPRQTRRSRWIAALAVVGCLASAVSSAILTGQAAASAASAPTLMAGVGRADITPPQTGYFLGGWTRADRLGSGVQTRLWSQAMVLQEGSTKVALVDVDLFAVPGGLQQQVSQAVSDLGFSTSNILLGATHTHAGPGGYANFPTLNTAAPDLDEILSDPASLGSLLAPSPADPQLYSFLVRQIAASIRAADADRAPAVAGWGHTTLLGVTQNRSLEAHLNDFGVKKATGTGKVTDDPGGYADTIDPNVDVLRVDKVRADGSRMPIGAWSQFADHGTVVKSEILAYTGDHLAVVHTLVADGIRAEGHVPASQLVLDVYGNGDEGDITAGLQHTGPAGANEVGTLEAQAMMTAWRQAGADLQASPALDLRWTRVCFCGQNVPALTPATPGFKATDSGPVSATGTPGLPFITGSDEGRGPLYDVTGVSFEGDALPISLGAQGDKIPLPVGTFPKAVPLMIVRVGDQAIVSMPGEATKEVGDRLRQAVLTATAGSGINRVVISGLTNEYINYITTPAEYDVQDYEGGSTMFGRLESVFLIEQSAALAATLASGQPAPAAYPYDPTNGTKSDGPAYPAGATSGRLLTQPAATVPVLGHATISWQGAPAGHDLPAGKPFVSVERQDGSSWTPVDSDLGLDMLWRVNSSGVYTAYWEAPLGTTAGTYRLVVTATGYRLVSNTFSVTASGPVLAVSKAAAGFLQVAVTLAYRAPVENVDLTPRPALVPGGGVTFTVNGRAVAGVSTDGGHTFTARVPLFARVSVAAGGAHDAAGDTNPTALAL